MFNPFTHNTVRKHASQIWRFAVAGGTGSIIDLGTLTLLVKYAGVSPNIAFIISTLLAVTVVFVINKYFTFGNKEKNVMHQALKFALVYGVAIVVNIAMSSFFFWVGSKYLTGTIDEVYVALIAKALAIGIGAVWNYTLSHGFVFKKNEDVDVVVG